MVNTVNPSEPMHTDKVVAVIPARGGSKRIPRKNVTDFDGRPLIAWTIEAARQSELFDRIVVSTDDEEIAETAIRWGAEVPFLRDSAADDMSPVSVATIRALQQLRDVGLTFNTVIQLFAVCPLRSADDIRAAYQYHKRHEEAFVISCHRYVGMNPWWAVKLDKQGHPTPVFENARIRSQDLPALYCPTGAIWIAQVERLLTEGTFYGFGHLFWEMDWKRAVDIDTFEDLALARALKLMAKEAH